MIEHQQRGLKLRKKCLGKTVWVDESIREGCRHLLLDFSKSHLLSVTRSTFGSSEGGRWHRAFCSLKMQMVLREIKLLI